VRKAVKSIGIERVAKILGIRKKYVYDIYGKDIGLRIPKFRKLVDESGIRYDPKRLRITARFGRGSLPAVIRIDNGLMRLFGLWLAEGDINKGNLRISTPDTFAKEDIKRTCESLGIKAGIYDNAIFIGSKILAEFMLKLGFNKYSTKKKMPGFVFTLEESLIREFLRGYYSGDGSVYPNQRGMLTVEATTYSKSLANDLMHILLQLGIVASVYSNRVGKSTRNGVCFRGANNIGRFLSIGFMDKKRNDMVREYAKKLKWTRSSQVPMFDELRTLLKENNVGREWHNSKTIGKDKLKEFISGIDPEKKNHKKLWSLLENDIYWDRVEEINHVPAKEEHVYDISINPSENFLAGFGGIFAHNSEENLRKIFEDAEKNAPAIIFFDEIDAIAPKREEVTGEVERRVVSQILTLMDGLKSRGKVIVIAATNRHNALDPALRRPGRFDREIEIGVPDQKGRKEILQIHTRNMPLTGDVNLDWLSSITYGFVGADLESLCKEAAMLSLRRNLPDLSWKKEEEFPAKTIEKIKVIKKDFENALKIVEPSAMREVLIEIPKVKWSDIGGLEEAKQNLKEVVQWPLDHPAAFDRIGIKPPKGVLLYGPPGSGKTLLAKAVANESGANFISVKGPEIFSKWVGESEKHIRDIFKRAKQVAPTIIFFDEIDALAPRRGLDAGTRVTENVVSMILTELSGLEDLHNVVVVAATNRPDILDPALLRPGRFDRQILVPAPDEKARLEIFKIHTKSMPLKGINLNKLAKDTASYSGADIEGLAREAGLFALRRDFKAKSVGPAEFKKAMSHVRPSINQDMVRFYEQIAERLRVRVKSKKDAREEEMVYVG